MMKNLFKRAQGRACPTFAERRKTGPTAIVRVFATLALMLMAATGAWAQSYNVTVKEGTEDAAKWSATPNPATAGQTVTVNYSGTKYVKSVKAVKKKTTVPPTTPLTMECLTDGTIVVEMRKPESAGGGPGELTTGMQYAKNGGTKTKITKTTTIEGLKKGDKVQFYGVGSDTQVYGDDIEVSISGGTARVKVYGNIMSLLDEDDFATTTDLPNEWNVFYGLFKDNEQLTDASGLLLPATTLAPSCYDSMFRGCSVLTAAPELPATELADYCYYYMFKECSALTAAPALPATTLALECYEEMFESCSALTAAPALPATKLADYCYYSMFSNCSALTAAPALPATKLYEGCYQHMFDGCSALTAAPALPATTLAVSCYEQMFDGCSALTAAPALPATKLEARCYNCMFSSCSALTTAPVLSATTLAEKCYDSMFYDCSKLASVTCKATNIKATDCLILWLEDAGTDESVTTRTLYVEPSMTKADWQLPGEPSWTITAISGN